jgi:hypothetical protein
MTKYTEVDTGKNVIAFPDDESDPLVTFIDEVEKASPPFYTVAIYLVDKAYGGHEEGGWWFEYGDRVDEPMDGILPDTLLSVFYQHGHLDRGAAYAQAHYYAETLQKVLDVSINVGRREISSMASEGRYYAMVHPGYPPQHFPERKPL